MQKQITIVNLDYSLTWRCDLDDAYSKVHKCPIKKVPVIRIFGITENGEKICVHVHKVYPYFYVAYDENQYGNFETFKEILRKSIESCLREIQKHADDSKHVHQIELVKKKSFYGYNDESHFIKISLYNPYMVRKLSNCFLNGHVLKSTHVQPYESHVPYILQFMIDYNLYGMSYLMYMDFKCRSNSYLQKITICKHEIDISAEWILNRFENDSNSGIASNPGLKDIWIEEKRRRNQSKDLSFELSDSRKTAVTASHLRFQQIMNEKFQSKGDELNTSCCTNSLSILNEFEKDISDDEATENIDFDSILSQNVKNVTNDEEKQDDVDYSVCFDSDPYLNTLSQLLQVDGADDFDESIFDTSAMMSNQCAEDKASENAENYNDRTEFIKIGDYQTLNWYPTVDVHNYKKVLTESVKDDNSQMEQKFTGNTTNLFGLKVLILELFIMTNDEKCPDPERDPIQAIFLACIEQKSSVRIDIMTMDGIMITGNEKVFKELNEAKLLLRLVKYLDCHDPDILIGYETESLSWGYVVSRGLKLGLNMTELISRVRYNKQFTSNIKPASIDSRFQPVGRILLNFWRILRHEIPLQSYSFENVIYHCLKYRVSKLSFETLSKYWRSDLNRNITVEYYKIRIKGIAAILQSLDFVARTCELARLFGMQFYEVLSRGSQFRVESMMLRLTKYENYVALSPNYVQRKNMSAPEYLPLILEPESKFYSDPVLVLDFQSLYPSMVIAYNYCFSTCIGRVSCLNYENVNFKFGTIMHQMNLNYVNELVKMNNLNYSPGGVAFVKKDVRLGILPKMLYDILETRLLIKNSMAPVKDKNSDFYKTMHSRQLGLKLIANVTYGYSAANFSGRMPLVELADSIVSKGRETLERAIECVQSNANWNARVVYGDTDSLFVLLKGKSKTEAFEIGEEIAKKVTELNPSPVKLKFEKVYKPCFLQTKKRYVGFMYESVDQTEPVFDAKGIETVRRDTCPIVKNILKKSIQLFFKHEDKEKLKQHMFNEFQKIFSNAYGIDTFIFAKEFRGFDGYAPSACVPSLELARKTLKYDRGAVPKRGERVPYVIVCGPPKVPLIKLVRSPHQLVSDHSLKLNYIYYISKCIIPSLNRCFLLAHIDINEWFEKMPKLSSIKNRSRVLSKQNTISQYFTLRTCVICYNDEATGGSQFCDKCARNKQKSYLFLFHDQQDAKKNFLTINQICQSCSSTSESNLCISMDCPIYFRAKRYENELNECVKYFKEFDF